MAAESGLKIGRSIVALLLFGAPATQPSFAENATSGARSKAEQAAGAKEWRSPGGMHGLKGSGPKSGGVKAPAGQGAPTVAKDVNATGLRARENARNAIGQPVVHQPAVGGSPSMVQRPAVTLGVTGNKPGSLANANAGVGGPGYLRSNASRTVPAAAVSRGRIDGAALIRPGVAPSGLGGPAKAVAGINGTAIRPKH
jgi:hypothetical protein